MAEQIPLKRIPFGFSFPKKISSKVRLGWTQIQIADDNRKTPLSVLVVHDTRNEKPFFLLTNMEIKSMEQAIKIFGFYLQRWEKEEGYRFSKSFLNLENIRTLNWRAIQSLAFIVFLAYLFVCLFYLSSPEQIESLAGERLKAFRSIKTVKF